MSHSAKELARQFGTDARTMRKFLRDITPRTEQPGQGKRWSVPENKKAVRELRDRFEEWNRPKIEVEEQGQVSEELAQAEQELIDAEDVDLEDMPEPSAEDLAMYEELDDGT